MVSAINYFLLYVAPRRPLCKLFGFFVTPREDLERDQTAFKMADKVPKNLIEQRANVQHEDTNSQGG